ncbi:hypothetical protein M9H77_25862 [Catharanthus roseus]|uniref:Uncharacterized protein n=1 Tax=Catharanthus roseus TaxID=4058 RepID=A0ACC0A8B9_CATRO|nr:hypothetical protein M9H77_25862 [Catharanthus roseus]
MKKKLLATIQIQAILVERFSKSKELEELHKHRTVYLINIIQRFHEVKRKAEEEAAATGTVVPDNLAITAIVAGGMNHGCVYRAILKAAHLRAKSSWPLLVEGLAPIWRAVLLC